MILLMGQVSSFLFYCHRQKVIIVGVRDYIHVVDVAIGHTAAMKKFEKNCGLKVRMKRRR